MGLCVFSPTISPMMNVKIRVFYLYLYQIGSNDPLFRVRSWNIGMHFMSFYIPMKLDKYYDFREHRITTLIWYSILILCNIILCSVFFFLPNVGYNSKRMVLSYLFIKQAVYSMLPCVTLISSSSPAFHCCQAKLSYALRATLGGNEGCHHVEVWSKLFA